MKNPSFISSGVKNANVSNKLFILYTGIILLGLVGSCSPKEDNRDAYLIEALQKTPDAYFENALVQCHQFNRTLSLFLFILLHEG
ncbi:MAG: hypothetical protein KAR17_21025 [Cyclobacteriaceae bacterium]|nr:hypothetical protein [Cyclobacteriaceae bacterium]